jgi:hypothetical protein
LINNINLVQCATAEFHNFNFSMSLKLFLRRMFSSKRQALPTQKTIDENHFIRLGRTLELPNDHTVLTHLHNIHILNFSLHETCWKRNVQFSVYDSSSTAKNSDSCVLYKNDRDEISCGFIVAIVSDSNHRCDLTIHTVYIDRGDSLTFKKKYVFNPFIFQGQLTDPPHLVTIDIQYITVKIAYSKVENVFHFFQYPNTAEST